MRVSCLTVGRRHSLRERRPRESRPGPGSPGPFEISRLPVATRPPQPKVALATPPTPFFSNLLDRGADGEGDAPLEEEGATAARRGCWGMGRCYPGTWR